MPLFMPFLFSFFTSFFALVLAFVLIFSFSLYLCQRAKHLTRLPLSADLVVDGQCQVSFQWTPTTQGFVCPSRFTLSGFFFLLFSLFLFFDCCSNGRRRDGKEQCLEKEGRGKGGKEDGNVYVTWTDSER